MNKAHGELYVPGRVCYAAQQPWVARGSLRYNITLGAAPAPGLSLEAVLDACALQPDVQALSGGLETPIGERGATLSGGQRQRVALARAVYRGGDVYLLDDPLGAVDGHVQQHLWHRCLRGALRAKTVVLCTHQLQYAEAADHVIVMEKGAIAWQVRRGGGGGLWAPRATFNPRCPGLPGGGGEGCKSWNRGGPVGTGFFFC